MYGSERLKISAADIASKFIHEQFVYNYSIDEKFLRKVSQKFRALGTKQSEISSCYITYFFFFRSCPLASDERFK